MVNSIKLKVALNFGSTVLPMLSGLVIIPLLIEGLGVERFGMLSIAWMIVGYFGVLDMGLGRALTQKVAHKIGMGDTESLKLIVIKALLMIGFLGCVACVATLIFSDNLIYQVFDLSRQYEEESLKGIHWIAFTIPFVIVSTGLFGVLEGQQYFGWTAIVRAPLNLLMFAAPWLAMHFGGDLNSIFASLFIVRFLAFVFLVAIVFYTISKYYGWESRPGEFKSLFVYGGWVTVSNVLSPIMVYFDRFYIASIIAVSVVAYYTTPLDLLTKSLLIPLALMGVMFPTFATEWRINRQKVVNSYRVSVLLVFGVMLPFSLLVFFYAKEGLEIWVGKDFAKHSFEITRVLAVGVFINSLAMVPYSLIQAIGRADIAAKCHALELPIFVILLISLVDYFGLIGAAYAWTIRVGIDALLLYSVSYKFIRI